jgi:4-amino-4-deoxy-L-arabinose transferase-like glycosyltransferase
MAALSYAWGMSNFPLESFYAAAARSMGSSWRDFFFGAVDPSGTVTLDKLPGAFWVQALSVRIFGFHFWSVALPQVIAGVLTVLVLYRVVRLLSGPKGGLVAALIMTASPVTALLNRGNVSDPMLVLLTVLAADATVRAMLFGRLRSLLLAGLWVGLAFQTKMLQAWLIVPALFLTYLVASPVSVRRRVTHVVAASVVLIVVSLSWMTVVSLIPGHDRPYVDGTKDDSLFVQVFVYNGWSRIGITLDEQDVAVRGQPFQQLQHAENPDVGTFRIATSPDRLLVGPLGRDDAWLLPAAVVSGLCLLVTRRSKPRGDLVRAGVILWGGWLLVLAGFFSFGVFINSYYTAALVPAIAALCAMGLAECWRSRARSIVSRVLLLIMVPATCVYALRLIPAGAGVRWWLLPLAGTVCLLAEMALIVSLKFTTWRRGRELSISLAALSLLLVPAATTGVVVAQGLGSFSTPYQSAAATMGTTTAPERFQSSAAQADSFWDRFPPGKILQVVDTSALAAPLIMNTGREFLPIGGFSGSNPSPTLARLIYLIKSHQVSSFFIPLRPGGDDPRLVWIRRHCLRTGTRPQTAGVEFGVYTCLPGLSKSSISAITSSPSTS